MEETTIENQNTQYRTKLEQPNKMYMHIGISLLVVVILVVGVTFAALQSIPGDALYTVKVNVIEKIQTSAHLSNKGKATYQVTLLTHRLAEVQKLREKEAVSEEMQAIFNTEMNKQSATFGSLIGEATDGAFPKTDVLFVINDFASVAGALEVVSEQNASLIQISNTAEDVKRSAVNLYRDKARSFVQTETQETVYSFIGNQLQVVKDSLTDTTLSKETSRSAERYLDRVEPALKESDLTKVIVSIAEAYRFVNIEQYADIKIPIVLQEKAGVPNATSTIQSTSSTNTQ